MDTYIIELYNQSLVELDNPVLTDFQKAEFLSLCQRAFDDNKNASHSTLIALCKSFYRLNILNLIEKTTEL